MDRDVISLFWKKEQDKLEIWTKIATYSHPDDANKDKEIDDDDAHTVNNKNNFKIEIIDTKEFALFEKDEE